MYYGLDNIAMLDGMKQCQNQFGKKNSNGSNFNSVYYMRDLKLYM